MCNWGPGSVSVTQLVLGWLWKLWLVLFQLGLAWKPQLWLTQTPGQAKAIKHGLTWPGLAEAMDLYVKAYKHFFFEKKITQTHSTWYSIQFIIYSSSLKLHQPVTYLRKPSQNPPVFLQFSVCRSGPCNRKKTENQTGPDWLGPYWQLRLHAFQTTQPVSKATCCACNTP